MFVAAEPSLIICPLDVRQTAVIQTRSCGQGGQRRASLFLDSASRSESPNRVSA